MEAIASNMHNHCGRGNVPRRFSTTAAAAPPPLAPTHGPAAACWTGELSGFEPHSTSSALPPGGSACGTTATKNSSPTKFFFPFSWSWSSKRKLALRLRSQPGKTKYPKRSAVKFVLVALLELGLMQIQMTQIPMLRLEVGARALRNQTGGGGARVYLLALLLDGPDGGEKRGKRNRFI